MQDAWKDYFENLYNMDVEEKAKVKIYGFESARKGNHFIEESVDTLKKKWE